MYQCTQGEWISRLVDWQKNEVEEEKASKRSEEVLSRITSKLAQERTAADQMGDGRPIAASRPSSAQLIYAFKKR